MKVIIAGSRTIFDSRLVYQAVERSGFEITEVVSGGAKGVDELGERWARSRSLRFTVFSAEWGKYGTSAGPVRNTRMAEYADALIAVWDGRSPGTGNMITTALAKGLKVFTLNLAETDVPKRTPFLKRTLARVSTRLPGVAADG